MMENSVAMFMFLLGNYLVLTSSNLQDDASPCIRSYAEYQLNCSPLSKDPVIYTSVRKYVIRNCFPSSNESSSSNQFLNFTIGRIENLKIRFCPLLTVIKLGQIEVENLGVFRLKDEVFWKNPDQNTTVVSESYSGAHLKNDNSAVIDRMFESLRDLRALHLSHNSLMIILEDLFAFANRKNLSEVDLRNSGLEVIPQHVFKNSGHIKILDLSNNSLQWLPEEVFSGLQQMKKLYLNENNISFIPEGLFSPLFKLEILDLESNKISEINNVIFRNLRNLKTLILKNNRIKTITLAAFRHNKKMVSLDLSNNLYSMKYEHDMNPFLHCDSLEILKLGGNLISKFPSSLMFLAPLKVLDLHQNHIRSIMVSRFRPVIIKELIVDLSDNEISEIDFQYMELLASEEIKRFQTMTWVPTTTVFLHNNTLICDCRVYELVKYVNNYLHPAVKALVDLRLEDTQCRSPQPFEGQKVEDIEPQMIKCPYPLMCEVSSNCQCFFRPFDGTVVVDCSYKNLTECPRIKVGGRRVELNLIGNEIRQGPDSSLGYDNVTDLFLSDNQITQLQWVPERSKVIKLDGNRLRYLTPGILEKLNSTSVLTLSDNPWECDCFAHHLRKFIIGKFGKRSNDVICRADNKPLTEKDDLCGPTTILILYAMNIFLGVALLLIGMWAVYRQYEERNTNQLQKINV